jgi:hypothetical protein
MTLSSMRSRIADDINTSDYNTQIDLAINRAIKHYSGEELWFTEGEATFPTVIDQKVYTSSDGIPTDIAEIRYVEYSDSAGDYEIQEKPLEWLEKNYSTITSGTPVHFTYWDESFRLYPTPNQVGTIRVFRRKTYPALSADSDTNDWLTYAEDLIEARARKWVNARILMDYDAARAAGIEEDEALMSLRRQHSDKKPCVIIPSEF